MHRIATACGVGGGGIYVPLGIILLRFASKPATGLSQASIFGASLGGLILNSQANHPDEKIRDTVGARDDDGKVIPYDKDMTTTQAHADEQAYLDSGRKFYTRPLIDYDMALFLSPVEMSGAVLGVIIQKLLANWLFLSLAGIILGVTSYMTYKKFFSAYKADKENREKKRMAESQPVEDAVLVQDDEEDKIAKVSADESTAVDTASDEDEEKLKIRRQLLEKDSRQFPIEKVMSLIVLWIGLAVIIFMKGGKGVDSIIGITCSSPWYAVLIACQFIWTFAFATFFGLKLVKQHKARVECDYPFYKNDILWNFVQLRNFSFFTFVAGIVAGLIGVGGGMVLGPLMLIYGKIHPRVSSATTATMIVLTSSSVAVMFVTSGLVPWEYAVLFFSINLVGAYIGKKYIDAYVKRTGMASILIGILATIIALATVGCFVIVLLNLSKASWCFDGFKSFCVDKQDGTECAIAKFMEGLETTASDLQKALNYGP